MVFLPLPEPTMTQLIHRESPESATLRLQVANAIREAALDFINDEINRNLAGFDAHSRMTSILTRTYDDESLRFTMFKLSFLPSIAIGTIRMANFDSTRHWMLVEAIELLDDSVPGRWTNTSEAEAFGQMQLALQYAESVGLAWQ
jgi:hypothetical protein